ncbi:FliH/SctL family protein [Flavobacterium akiainvivens]|uniref:hypothetical protein n=1 Tax=Flavobacterium akiainvivens TaxID=1202724 RepID=UPI0006C8838A|nr:hypothetical protein [Flavobacterium akiainvivens]SFQ22922.1 hypothetical protein SAMN05444144_10265 [Flavobacterium akiainvivens]
MKKIFLLFCIGMGSAYAQVSFPHGAASGGDSSSERVSNFTVAGAGNDRLEIANGTQNNGKFIPTFWSYRDTDNTFSMVFTSSVSSLYDTGSSPLMLFTTTIPTSPEFGNGGEFVWGPAGTYQAIVNRPLFEWRNASTKLMTIIANGNVGIATSTPTARFHTVGSVRFQDLANATTPAYMLGTDNNGNVYEYPVPTGGTGSQADADFLKPDGSVPMSINDNIYTNGFTGFNVQNPLATIHTNGTLRFENLANATTPAFMLGTDSNGNVYEYPVPTGGTGGQADADFLKPDGSVPMSINDNIYTNGFTGFNVQNPTSVIHANGTVTLQNLPNTNVTEFLLGTDANGNVFEVPVPTATGSIADADFLKPDGSVPMNINDNIYTNGFTGFNVQNPTSVIHANGTVTFENLANATTPAFMLGTDANGNVFEYPVPDGGGSISDADWLKPDGTLPMNINDNIYTNGKVGINTNTFPTQVGTEDVSFYNLFVTGGILTEEVRVAEVDDWADYVFKPDYKLPTLKEVEEYIQQKGHLINIPSETEVKQNGVELTEMNKLLLEKVEELTLYVIDMNKKIEEQQKEIEQLKAAKK